MEVKPENDDDNIHTHEAWSGGGININIFTNLDQDALNMAVKDGYDDGAAASSGRMSLYASIPNIMGGGGGGGGQVVGAEDMLALDPEQSQVNNPLSPTGGMDTDASNKGGAYQFVSSSNLQPVGIIDLECYSAVNRSKMNPTVLELAGDSVTNPDLRSFYFQSPSIEDAESWTKALLSDRHQSLKDETEAYKQVCESFPLQLANCSHMIDTAEAKAEEMEREAYSVRSANEEGRRKVVSAVREMLERGCWETEASKRKSKENGRNKKGKFPPFDGPSLGNSPGGLEYEETKSSISDDVNDGLVSVLDAQYEKLETNRAAFLRELEAALSSPSAVATSNVVPPVQTLVDYTSAIVGSYVDLRSQLQKYELDMSTSVQQDQTQLEALKDAIEGRNAQLADEERKHSMIMSDLKAELQASRHQTEEITKQLEAQRMEFGMYQNATKNKMSELQQHKKILKREVIELRKKIDECGSENTTVAHEYEKIKSSYQTTKDKNTTLERYIGRLEKQVGVQQNMMEMMSQGGGASFVGKVVGPGVTQNDSKDAISLSGMSLGSHYRKLNGSMSSLGGGQQTPNHHGENKSTSYSSQRPRQLLPPESSKSTRAIHDVSPLPTPSSFQDGEGKGSLKSVRGAGANNASLTGDDDRDPSMAYYQSTTTTEADDSPGTAERDNRDVAVDSPKRTPKRQPSMNDETKDASGNDQPSGEASPVMSPKSPDEQRQSLRAEATRTPIQSNSFVDEVARDIFDADEDGSKHLPHLDSDADRMLDVNSSKSASIEEDGNNMKVSVSLTPADLPRGGSSPDLEADDMDDNVSRVSDITEDRTQRQIDDDLAERRKILLAYVNKTNGGGSSNFSLSNASTQRRLETIETMLPSIESQGASASDSRSSGMPSGRMSVAQRARQNAENRSNSHRSPSTSPMPGDSHSQRLLPAQDAASVNSSTPKHISSNSSVGSRTDTIGRSGSWLKGIGKAIEKTLDSSVLGVSLPADDYDDASSYEGTESEILSSVVSEASVSRALANTMRLFVLFHFILTLHRL